MLMFGVGVRYIEQTQLDVSVRRGVVEFRQGFEAVNGVSKV
jgi:hypothetical protein